jgi:hypothetical protein
LSTLQSADPAYEVDTHANTEAGASVATGTEV